MKYIVCTKEYKDEYDFIYKKGESFECTFESDVGFTVERPGEGPMGSLAIVFLPKLNFIDREAQRNEILNKLLY